LPFDALAATSAFRRAGPTLASSPAGKTWSS
jgi:hypothetical protein